MASQFNLSISTKEHRERLVKTWLEDQFDVDVLFACAICHNAINVEHPIHCPRCSKLFCASCITQWFATRRPPMYARRCPCCQSVVTLTQFNRCRVYQDVRDIIEGLQGNVGELIQKLTKPVRVCEEHNKELLLFCQKCSKCICVKCILNDHHRMHIDEVLELDDAREKLKASIAKENTFLAERIAALNRAGARVAAQENDMLVRHGEVINKLARDIDALFEKIQDDKDERIKQFLAPVKAITTRQQEDVQRIVRRTFELGSEETSPEVVMRTLQMLEAIKKMHNEPLPVLQLPDTEFVNPLTPPPLELYFFIRSFSKRILKTLPVYSVPKNVEGFLLQLKAFHDLEEDAIKLTLRIIEGYTVNDIQVTCYPTLGGEPLVRRMDLKKGEENTVLEFPDFPSMCGFLDGRSDELHVQMKFSLWPTYYHKCAHKDWYIQNVVGSKRVALEESH